MEENVPRRPRRSGRPRRPQPLGRVGVVVAVLALAAVVAGLALAGGGPKAWEVKLGPTTAAPRGSGRVVATVDGPNRLRITLTVAGVPPDRLLALWVEAESARFEFPLAPGATTGEWTIDIPWSRWRATGVNALDGNNAGRGTPVLRSHL